jgi:hypothetical protein
MVAAGEGFEDFDMAGGVGLSEDPAGDDEAPELFAVVSLVAVESAQDRLQFRDGS